MRQKVVGVYEIGYEKIEVVLRDGNGGEFHMLSENSNITRIKIGADYENWRDVLAVFLHETMEFSLDRLKCRYYPSNDLSNSTDRYVFITTHNQFSDACAKVAECAADCVPDLKKIWKKWKKKNDNSKV